MAQMTLTWPRRSRLAAPAIHRPRDLWRLLALPMLLFLALPLVAMFMGTPPGLILANLSQPEVLQAIRLSLTTSVVTTLLVIIWGLPLAYLLARREVPFRRVIDTFIDLPTVLPPAVAGVALLMAFGRRGLVGSYLDEWGVHLAFTQAAVVMAQIFVAAPFFIKAAMVGFHNIDPELEQAAALDGATEWQTFQRVMLPLAWTALLSGAVMTWARALGEFGATIIFAGNFPGRTQTMPLAIYLGFELDLSLALTLSVILVGCSFLVLVVIKILLNREPS